MCVEDLKPLPSPRLLLSSCQEACPLCNSHFISQPLAKVYSTTCPELSRSSKVLLSESLNPISRKNYVNGASFGDRNDQSIRDPFNNNKTITDGGVAPLP